MWNMTERQKMISGQLYKSGVKELVNDRMLCKEQCYDFNALRPSQTEEQRGFLSYENTSNPRNAYIIVY